MTSRKQCVIPSVPESLNVFFINLPLQVAQERGSRRQSPSRCLRTAVRLTVSAAHRARRVLAAVTHRAAGLTVEEWKNMWFSPGLIIFIIWTEVFRLNIQWNGWNKLCLEVRETTKSRSQAVFKSSFFFLNPTRECCFCLIWLRSTWK